MLACLSSYLHLGYLDSSHPRKMILMFYSVYFLSCCPIHSSLSFSWWPYQNGVDVIFLRVAHHVRFYLSLSWTQLIPIIYAFIDHSYLLHQQHLLVQIVPNPILNRVYVYFSLWWFRFLYLFYINIKGNSYNYYNIRNINICIIYIKFLNT